MTRPSDMTLALPARAALCALMVLALLGLQGCGQKDARSEEKATPRPVEVAKVEWKSFDHRLEIVSTAEALNRAVLTADVPGTIETLLKDKGDRVEAGEELARLDRTDYRIAFDSAKAQLAVAKAAVSQAGVVFATAEKNQGRFRELYEQKAVSQSEHERVETALAQARAGLEIATAQQLQAEAGLHAAERRLADTSIRTPFSGYVVERFRDIGEMASPQTPLFTVVNTDVIRLDVSLTELELAGIDAGLSAEVAFDAFPQRTFTAAVDSINQQVSPVTKTLSVRLRMDNPEHLIKPGMTARVRVNLPPREYLVVPRNAVLTRDNESGRLFVVAEDRRIEERPIVMGGTIQGYAILVDGAQAGERVVISGSSHLEPGATVEITKGE